MQADTRVHTRTQTDICVRARVWVFTRQARSHAQDCLHTRAHIHTRILSVEFLYMHSVECSHMESYTWAKLHLIFTNTYQRARKPNASYLHAGTRFQKRRTNCTHLHTNRKMKYTYTKTHWHIRFYSDMHTCTLT